MRKILHCCYLLILNASFSNHVFSETLTISEDRKYLESGCPHAGIQELLLHKEGVFKFTTYNLDLKTSLMELSGRWKLDGDVLNLAYVNNTVRFHTEGRVEELLDKKYLLAVLTPMASDQRYPFTNCTYVDKRLVRELTGID